jgi:putative membrane protein
MHRRSLIGGSAAALALLPVAGVSFAQSGSVDEAKLPALMGGDFATATSELAASKASNASVKTFAQLEIAEQAAVAEAFGSTPGAAGLSEEHAAMVAQLQELEGAEFDQMYIQGQIAGHEELLSIHQAYAQNGEDPMARGASLVGVTGIQTHLVMLQSIQASLSA